MDINAWAIRHNVSASALSELRSMMVSVPFSDTIIRGTGESAAQNEVRLKATQHGWRLWRNNVGAGKLENGSYLRWGLANDSQVMNVRIKSADLIGIKPITIMPEHIGQTIGQFVSREVKTPGWRFNKNSPHEVAQLAWIELLTALGADASFTTGGL